MHILKISLPLLSALSLLSAASVSPLYQRGYTVMPEPQKVTLDGGDFQFGSDWWLELGAGIRPADTAVEVLKEELDSRFHLRMGETRARGNVLRLSVTSNSAVVGAAQDRDTHALAAQAYRIDLSRHAINIKANGPAGLFYGIETLVQMLRRGNGALWLPEGHIEDWPDLQLRQIYWDDAHHLDRPETLKKAIRQAAFFKINGFALKLEGHFQFKSAPAIVEPYALTPAEFQDLTSYGLKYHVQLIPYLDAPGHVAFILKHPEYAGLREYPDSNYELCATNPDSYKLMFGMFRDLIEANQGVNYFYLSTDEPYYVGLADNAQCNERSRGKELGSVGKLLAEFIAKTANYLHEHGRTVIFWGEYPMKPDDLASLPRHLINGEVAGPEFDPVFKKRGIREMIYTSSEGEEKFFPDYFSLPASRRLHPETQSAQRVQDTFGQISHNSARQDADLIGTVNAGWADMGLHPETFWLGYATAASAAWHPGSPDPRESMSAFYTLFYGADTVNMDRVYQLMSTQAQVWADSWDPIASTARTGIWGNSNGVYESRRPAHDQAIPIPPAPDASLRYRSDWAETNHRRLQLVAQALSENDELTGLLQENMKRADPNRYNLSVFVSIAGLYRQNLEMLSGMRGMDSMLKIASAAADKDETRLAIQSADRALDAAQAIQYSRNHVLNDARQTWYKSWYPRVAEANGRKFLHQVDDVKDHLPDRTIDMSYLVYREMLLPFGEWVERIRAARNLYALSNHAAERNRKFDWYDLSPISGSER